jgi:hypothetical protein
MFNKKTIMILGALVIGYYFWTVQTSTTAPAS